MSGSSPGNPFVGPRPLEKGQSIFGRNAEIDQLYYLLSAERIVLFHSPSGAGKTSLLQAGLFPRLARHFDVWIPARVNLAPDPASSPAVNRYVRSCNLSFEAELPAQLQRPPELVSAMSLSEYTAGRPRRRSAPSNTVLLFDQFEEILTVDPLAFDARREFFSQLGALLQDPRFWAIFALREDYLAQLDPYAAALPTHLKNRFRLDLLSRDAAQEAIRLAVESAGRNFAPAALSQLVADLAMMQVQQPSGEFKNQPGPWVEPLHLQVACHALWQRLPAARTVIETGDVTSLGNVTAALSAYYQSEVATIAANDELVERSIRRWFGEELIACGAIRGQVLREAGSSGGLTNSLIDRLIDSHLVRAETRASATWYELAHDRLIEPVLRDNERWFAAHLTLVQQRALQWQREGEPESLLLIGRELTAALRWAALPGRQLTSGESRFLLASRKKRNRVLQTRAAVAALFVFLLGTSLLGLIAMRENKRAEYNLTLATRAVDQTLSSAGREQAREFSDSPQMEAFRKELLVKARTFYSAFTHEDSSSRDLRFKAAWGHSRLGDVNRLLDRPVEALVEYRTAIAGFSSLAARYPRDPEYREALGYCHNWMGETLRVQFQNSNPPDSALAAQATNEYDTAISIQRNLRTARPQDRQFTQELARTFYNRGFLESDLNDRSAAESDFRAAIALLEPIAGQPVAHDSDSPPPAEDLDRVDNNLAALLSVEGRDLSDKGKNDQARALYDEARPLYEHAVAIAHRLADAHPDNREYRAELAYYSNNEAIFLADTKQLAAAADRNHEALDLVEALANPAPSLSLEELKILQLRSKILIAQGSKDALQQIEQERELLTRLESGPVVSGHPVFHEMYYALAFNYVQLAEIDLKSGDLEGAQLSLNSLALVFPQLTPEDREAAREHYEQLRARLRAKISH